MRQSMAKFEAGDNPIQGILAFRCGNGHVFTVAESAEPKFAAASGSDR
jgi:hypothetical protein